MKSIEIPPFLSHLKVDERGYPIPFFVAYVKGKPDFRMIDPKKFNYCFEQDLCFVCGKKHVKKNYFIVTGPQGLANGVHSDCPSHRGCLEYSLKICPHLFFESSQRNERGEHYNHAVKTTGVAGVKEKPDILYLIKADKWVTIPGPNGGVLIKFRKVSYEEYHYLNGTLKKI
jgi:hypothetical protein